MEPGGWVRDYNNQGSIRDMGLQPPGQIIDIPKVCSMCKDATPTFVDEGGNGTCDPCTWAATAPYYVKPGSMEMELDGRKSGLKVTGIEYHVVRREDGMSVGSRKKLQAAYDLCGYWNRGHEIEE